MNTVVSEPRIKTLRVTDDEIVAQLVDGRVISVPLAWSWRLSDATAGQRANFRLIGAGQGVQARRRRRHQRGRHAPWDTSATPEGQRGDPRYSRASRSAYQAWPFIDYTCCGQMRPNYSRL